MLLRCIAPECRAPREVGALFCRVHLAAPPGKRGGWISAERRRQKQANHVVPLDASNITRRLWVGSKPPLDRDLPGFDMLALCAEQFQPERLAFGRQIVRVPVPDGVLTTTQINAVLTGSREVAKALASGKTVLVTCMAGLNRSALVAGLALGLVTRMRPTQIVDLIRERRAEGALYNPYFVELIHHFVGQRQRVGDKGDGSQ